MKFFRWFISSSVRNASAVQKHYRRLLAAQSDLLSSANVAAVQIKLDELTIAIREGHTGRMNIKAEELQFAAEKNLKPYPFPAWRENVEVLLVALAVAMAIRTFFIQPFKIPTGSMQPTLFGVTAHPDYSSGWMANRLGSEDQTITEFRKKVQEQKTMVIPTGLGAFKEWLQGNSYISFVAPVDGMIESIGPVNGIKIINISQKFTFAGQEHTIWFPPDYGEVPGGLNPLQYRAGLIPGRTFRKGEDVIKLRMSAGDHLFVDRLTYNFRKPTRGETIVFATAGTQITMQDQFYIKRLTVLPNERVSIGDDRHMRINGQRIDAATPHFANVYGFNPDKSPTESQFSGHVNGTVAQRYNLFSNLAPLFPDESTVFTNGPDAYMVFGDNTCNSSDSRTWGTLPAKNVIGKAFFVYWPLTSRFGVGSPAN
ncbi:MAG: Signal peptidase [Verrucomicrobiota bacterium]|jgi:signal peptidase I